VAFCTGRCDSSALEKIIKCEQDGKPARVLASLSTMERLYAYLSESALPQFPNVWAIRKFYKNRCVVPWQGKELISAGSSVVMTYEGLHNAWKALHSLSRAEIENDAVRSGGTASRKRISMYVGSQLVRRRSSSHTRVVLPIFDNC